MNPPSVGQVGKNANHTIDGQPGRLYILMGWKSSPLPDNSKPVSLRELKESDLGLMWIGAEGGRSHRSGCEVGFWIVTWTGSTSFAVDKRRSRAVHPSVWI